MTSKMKNFSMNKMLNSIKKKPTFSNAGSGSGNGNGDDTTSDPTGDGPEATATRYVKQFCMSDSGNSGDEVAFLPSIVEAAESSPAAAAECARLIRKYLHRDYWTKPSLQYNAIMLIRILADNPGATFTRNMDKKFADTTKELLRSGKDGNVRQMLMETLDAFENTKGYDENLQFLIEMWKREKEKAYRVYGSLPNQQEYFQRAQHTSRLPDPVELANRLEEARTSAKLLEQVVACTPPHEILSNDLIKEFADRCTSASRSIQEYMSATDPAPDNDTMESLIDTNEQLQQSLNHHQRAVLNAKKQLGLGSPGSESMSRPGSVAPVVNEQSRPPPAASGTSNSRNEGVQDWLASSSAAAGGSGSGSGSGSGRGAGVGASSSSRGKGKAAATSSDDNWGLSDSKYESISSRSIAGGSFSAAAAGPSRSHAETPYRDEEDPFRDPIQPDSSASSMRRVQPSTLNTTNVGNNDERLSFEPYHPGFDGSGHNNSTSDRKSINDNYSYNSSSAYDYMGVGGGSGTGAGAGKASNSIPEPVTPVSDDGLYGSGDVHRSTGVQR
ncbi:GAT-like domain-containing protein [Neurospora crassa]|uniref:GAT domain-containing protein n=1 Tax=Neurospora crassa (strain ATCC 24698 / 74-OR23-1A / CBS 708.71 / DSM 1257 / FGSC 987) TaxID=367110 RepID=V5IQM5_NEUCR|nr:hypothetical protein NCU01927 [Neurospora crassa OR74A]ESA43854.1 hypothetical protein NCU01927 [Neurospora crassa OR74A]KHE83004.1 GAT-like domain-containing protein [Neurospora crassa]|eukprot:XP_011392902.1 hypothetical protein NCU01927 [Neurospora crassa OR74A]